MSLEEYRSEIIRLIDTRENVSIDNGSAEHAAVIVSAMFEKADKTIRILTRKLDAKIYARPKLLREAAIFIADPSNKCEIIVEDFDRDNFKTHPFVGKFFDHPNVDFYELSEELGNAINTNFATMDDRGIRMEKERGSPKAFANFGDTKFVGKMNSFFNRVKEIATVIERDQPVGLNPSERITF